MRILFIFLTCLSASASGWYPHKYVVAETSTNTGGGGEPYTANATTFHGTNGLLTSSSVMTNSKTLILSMWVKPVYDGKVAWMVEADGTEITAENDRTLKCIFKDGNSNIVTMQTSMTIADDVWSHVLISLDVSDANKRWVYINDTNDASVTWTEYYNVTLYWASANWSVAQVIGGGYRYRGCMSEVYFNPVESMDFSNVTNRRKFISADKKPVSLGSDGSTPTGGKPAIYLKSPYTSFEVNSGYSGDFTVQNGGFTECTAP